VSVTSLFSKDELIEMLKSDKAFRDTFALEFVKNSIPNQLKALRKERDWTQDDLGREAGKPRNVITRLENPASHIPNLATLYEMAIACRAALLVKIIPFSRLLKEMDAPFSSDFAPAIDSKEEADALTQWSVSFDGAETGDSELPVSERANLVAVGGNPRKSANQRVLSLAPLRLVSSNRTVDSVQDSQNPTRNVSVNNVSLAR